MKKTYTLLLMLIAASIFSSCASLPIEVKDFEGWSEIDPGGSADLKWHFANADYVKIEGYDREFEEMDSLSVSPAETSKYLFHAIQDEDDTVSLTWRVFVSNKQREPQTGPAMLNTDAFRPSYEESEYLSGIFTVQNGSIPARMRIMRTVYPRFENDPARFHAIVLDRFGNYLTGLSNIDSTGFEASLYCKMGTFEHSPDFFREDLYTIDEPPSNICLLLDNSMAAEYNAPAVESARNFPGKLDSSDGFMFSIFNHDYYNIIPLQENETALAEMNNSEIPIPSGLNALYKSIFLSLIKLGENNPGSRTALIAVVYGSDNSSLIYEAKDVAELAREYGIPIYIVGVGDAVESYTLKYLCDISGGRFYYLQADEISQLDLILQEILVAQKTFYEFEVPVENYINKCNEMNADIYFHRDENKTRDEIRLMFTPLRLFPRYQSLACFDYKKTDVAAIFENNLRSFARVLKDNPGYSIELIGHSSIEGDYETNMRISMERAENARKALISLGVAPSQLKVRAEGSNMPVYYLQHVGWQQYYNRRVEVRWLDPDMMPFEIIAEHQWTESEAKKNVENWKNRGMNSYYQRYLYNNIPIYRVKLWGYKTIMEAERAAGELEKNYEKSFRIE